MVSNYTYNNDNQLTVNDSTSYTHDNKGNQTAAGTKTFEYNFDNKLTKYIEPTATTEYKYDGIGNRLSQKVGTVTTQFVNDVSGDLTKVLVAKNTSTNTSNYFVQGLGSTLSEGGTANTARQYYIHDGTGNVRFVTDNTGAKLQYLSYDPYGNPLGSNGTDVFQYKGEQADQGGMYFMRARYYDPATGRFISKDPLPGKLNNPQSQNGYNYANNDPINSSDPSGESGQLIAAIVGVGATAMLGGYITGGAIDGAMNSCNGNVLQGAANGAGNALNDPIGQALMGTAVTAMTMGAPQQYSSDFSKSPGPGYVWKGSGSPGSSQGSWVNAAEGQTIHPDYQHGPPIGPHADWTIEGQPNGYRLFPDGSIAPK